MLNSSTSDEEELSKLIDDKDSATIQEDPIPPVIGEEGARQRDVEYTNLFRKYTSNYDADKKQSISLKKKFFWIIMVLFFFLGTSGIVLLFLGFFIKSENALAIIITATVNIFTSFIAIPTIIANHLFPKKIDQQIIKVMNLLVQNDDNIRKARETKEHDIRERNKK